MGDKRTLLAFLLIGLIFLLMPYYFEWMGLTPAPQETASETGRPAEREISQEVAEEIPAPPQNDVEPHSEELAQVPEQPANSPPRVFSPRDILVRTPLQELIFSTGGGVLVSTKLPQYQRQVGETVELMPNAPRALAIELRDENGRLIQDLSNVEFVPSTRSLFLESGSNGHLKMRANLGRGRLVEKHFLFDADRYGIQMELSYSGFDEQTFAFLVWEGGIAIAERAEYVDLESMQAMAYLNENLTELRAEAGEPQNWEEKGALRWAGVRNKYFFSSVVPTTPSRYSVELQAEYAVPVPEYDYRIGFRLSRNGTWEGLLYIGPLDYEELILYEAELERAMDLGFPIVREISKVLIVLFVEAYQIVPNYGWVIVLFAVVVKILVYPLTHKSYESASKMQELQPKVAALKEKYKNDNQRLSRETMKLYRDEGVNPLGGCLPLLLQMPIFIALYQTFSSTIELRQSPFILWIDDLSLPDEVLVAGISIHILPLLMSAAMFFQSKMTMKDPKQAALVYIMPVVMVFIMWRFSSGLVLYWTVFNVLQIAQQHFTNLYKQRRARPA